MKYRLLFRNASEKSRISLIITFPRPAVQMQTKMRRRPFVKQVFRPFSRPRLTGVISQWMRIALFFHLLIRRISAVQTSLFWQIKTSTFLLPVRPLFWSFKTRVFVNASEEVLVVKTRQFRSVKQGCSSMIPRRFQLEPRPVSAVIVNSFVYSPGHSSE